MSSAGSLQLDGDSLILARHGVLHVFNRRGAFDLRGRGIDALHARMAPFLQGTHEEGTLIAAVPPAAAGPLRSYFERMRQAGALRTAAAEPRVREAPPPVEALGPARPRGRFLWRSREIEISLDGPCAPPPGLPSLEFLSPEEAGRWILRFGEPGRPLGNRTCVVDAAAPAVLSERELLRRAAFARWLIGSGIDLERGEHALVYELGARPGELRRRAVIDRGAEHSLYTLPEQLELIRGADLDQLPLVVATAAHPFFKPTLRRMGLDYATVRRHLLRDFVARTCFEDAGTVRFFQGEPDSPLASYGPRELAAEAALSMPVAATLRDLRLTLLEQSAERLAREAELPWREVDLLTVEEPHSAVLCLQRILRLRIDRLPARWAETRDGAVLVESGGRRVLSFLRAKALADFLLAVAWDLFYGPRHGEAPASALGYDAFAPHGELLRMTAAQMVTNQVPMLVCPVRRWGITAWVGGWEGGE